MTGSIVEWLRWRRIDQNPGRKRGGWANVRTPVSSGGPLFFDLVAHSPFESGRGSLFGRGTQQPDGGSQGVHECRTRCAPRRVGINLLARADVQIVVQEVRRQVLNLFTVRFRVSTLEYA